MTKPIKVTAEEVKYTNYKFACTRCGKEISYRPYCSVGTTLADVNCSTCGANYIPARTENREIRFTAKEGDKSVKYDLIVALDARVDNHLFVLLSESVVYDQGCASIIPYTLDVVRSLKHIYEQHTCPVNFCPVDMIVDTDGVRDPHGIFKLVYIGTSWKTGIDQRSLDDWETQRCDNLLDEYQERVEEVQNIPDILTLMPYYEEDEVNILGDYLSKYRDDPGALLVLRNFLEEKFEYTFDFEAYYKKH